MQSAHQQSPARPSDLGLQHFGVYVDDIDAAVERFVAAGGELVAAPAPTVGVEAGPRNAYCYAKTPWGTVIELITHPSPGASSRRRRCDAGHRPPGSHEPRVSLGGSVERCGCSMPAGRPGGRGPMRRRAPDERAGTMLA